MLRLSASSLAFGIALFRPVSADAAEPHSVEWLPGDAREISHSASASRDTAALDAIVAPRFSVTLGTEFGLVAWHLRDVTLRAGASALFGLESQTPSKRLFPAPGGDSNLWRGVLGYEVAGSFDRFASDALGQHGGLEAAVAYYHESDHHTASNEPLTPGAPVEDAELRGRPQIGNFVAVDFAARFPIHALELTLRHESKLFVNGSVTPMTPFRAGTSDELGLQLHDVLPSVTPFWSTFVEELWAKDRAPTRYFRSLLGVSLPGVRGELRLYVSYDAGAGKGLLIPEQEHAFGAGFRYTPFEPTWR